MHDNAAACRAILARAERDLGKDAVSGRTPPLAGWQVGKSKVFLKFWHLDALAVLVQRHNNAAVKLQVRHSAGKLTICPDSGSAVRCAPDFAFQAAMTGIACRCRLRKVMVRSPSLFFSYSLPSFCRSQSSCYASWHLAPSFWTMLRSNLLLYCIHVCPSGAGSHTQGRDGNFHE